MPGFAEVAYIAAMPMRPTTGWGLFPSVQAHVSSARFREDLVRLAREPAPLLAQGSCRSYGDACLFPRVVSTLPLKHLLDFDPGRGLLRAEAGATIDEIIRFALPRGWFPPVTPGTKFPTLGGCIAADVHGKNHHVDGSIARFVDELEMVLADGTRILCSPHENSDLFRATLGGMGLTGFVYAATLRLKPVPSAYIDLHSIRTADLRETFTLFAETQNDYVYSVAWIDCLARGSHLGRGIVMLGNHTPADRLAPARRYLLHGPSRWEVPFHLPEMALNPWSMKAFNALYYRRHRRRRAASRVHYDPFFYPLDALGRWNRIYGRRGFLQYQFAIPYADGLPVMEEILARVAAQGTGSFLAVLKAFGPQQGLLSFPMHGYTLALDFPMRDGRVVDFLRQLDEVVAQAGGRVYLAKDAILGKDSFAAMYPALEEFRSIRHRYDPERHFRSCLSDRLGIS